jgi:hypothetical protein
MLWIVLLSMLQEPPPIEVDWQPENEVGISYFLDELERFCDANAKSEVYLQYDEPGYLDMEASGCNYTCQRRLLRGTFEFIEAEVVQKDDEDASSYSQRNLISEPGKYRFSAQTRGHKNCALYENRRVEDEKRGGSPLYRDHEGLCVAAEKVVTFKSRFGVDRSIKNNYEERKKRETNFAAAKEEIQIIRLSTGEVESKLVTLRLQSFENNENEMPINRTISCGNMGMRNDFVDHVLAGQDLPDYFGNRSRK